MKRLTDAEYAELADRARTIRKPAMAEFLRLIQAGAGADEIRRKLFDMVPGQQRGRSLKDIDDDTLVRSLTNPVLHRID